MLRQVDDTQYIKAWSWGFVFVSVFILCFDLGYALTTLEDVNLVVLLMHNLLGKLCAVATLFIGITGLRGGFK